MTKLPFKCVLELRVILLLHSTTTKCRERLILILFGRHIMLLIIVQTYLYVLFYFSGFCELDSPMILI
jgi:hypothetical protein